MNQTDQIRGAIETIDQEIAILTAGREHLVRALEVFEGGSGEAEPEKTPEEKSQVETAEPAATPQPVQSKPNKPRKKTQIPKKGKAKRWTDQDILIAREMVAEGATSTAVAKRLGRSQKATSVYLTKLRKQMAAEKSSGAVEEQKPAKKPETALKRVPTAARTRSTADHTPPAKDPESDWTPERDLELVAGVCSGIGLPAVASSMKTDQGVCLKRWQQLLPKPTPDSQAKLLAELRAKVEERAA